MADEAHNSSLRGCISLPLLKNGKVNLGIQRRPGDSNHPQGVVTSLSPRLNQQYTPRLQKFCCDIEKLKLHYFISYHSYLPKYQKTKLFFIAKSETYENVLEESPSEIVHLGLGILAF